MADMKFTTDTKPPRSNPAKAGFITLAIIIAVLFLIILFSCFSVVNEGFIGVQYRFGRIVKDDLSAGLNFKIPFIDNIEQVDIREQVYEEADADAYTSDNQTVEKLNIKLNYMYEPSKLSGIIQNVGVGNVESKLIRPKVRSVAKDVIGKVKTEDLVKTRSQVQLTIQETLSELLAPSGIIVQSFAIENLQFEAGFEESVRAKVVAEQDALKAQNKTREREEEAKQTVIAAQAQADSALIKAEAEAKAIELIQKQIAQNPLYVEYLKATRWDGKLPQAIGTEVNPFINFTDSTTTTTTTTTTPVTPAQ